MSKIKVTPVVDHEKYDVNGKEVLCRNGEATSQQELTSKEKIAFYSYHQGFIASEYQGKHPVAIYDL
ncbi:MAG TPA: hypothetical protein VK050_08545 [Flavobacteriaceae bacterium]|nr:hypothetical protein [Flavobacteriaceae bacterium]